MKDKPQLRRGATIIVCAASLVGGATAAAPTAASAHAAASSCGAKTIKIPQKGGKALDVPASRIKVAGGATCAEAYAVIHGVLTKNLPSGWVVRPGKFSVPDGLTAEMAMKGSKMVQFAVVGS